MRIEIQGINMKITDDLKNKVENKLEKYHRFFGDDARCLVKAQPEHDKCKVELNIKVRGDLFRAEAVEQEVLTALDLASDNLGRQIRKHKSKLKKRKRDDEHLSQMLETLPDWEEPIENAPRITRRKNFVINTMDPEEAAMQMELIDHDFFLYLSPDTGRVAVIYRRHDGDYGILEPEY